MDDPDVRVRELRTLDEVADAAALIDRIWGEDRIVSPALLRAVATHGNPVLGAYRNGALIGAQVGFVGMTEDGPLLHSHITGVATGLEHGGVGLVLKRAQRDWCLAHGIELVTWTFDPMVARNAYFNLRKLGAVAWRFHRDFYGPMTDAFNAGDRSDRLEVRWELTSSRVAAALKGRPLGPDRPSEAVLEADDAGRPRRMPLGGSPVLLGVPADYHALRRADPDTAAAWRGAVADVLEEAFGRGYLGTDFVRHQGYVLERG